MSRETEPLCVREGERLRESEEAVDGIGTNHEHDTWGAGLGTEKGF